MKTLAILASLFLLLTLAALACAAPPPTPIPTATPDIPATVTARVAAIPTATAYPTSTPYPTATPRPTVTPYPTATPRPTYTPYPTPTAVPTATPYPTNTPYPTATPRPTYTPYPTPTPTPAPTPTATPWPTATPEPQVPWTTQRPRNFFSIEMPTDWRKSTDDTSKLDGDVDLTVVNFDDPGNKASVRVVSYYSSYGWRTGYTLDESAQEDLEVIRDSGANFQLLSLQSVSATVKRSQYQYDGTDDYCDIAGQGLHILLPEYIFAVTVEVCAPWAWKYDDDFVDRMLDSFSYPGKR